MYTVKIKRSSIRRNPHQYGGTRNMPGNQESSGDRVERDGDKLVLVLVSYVGGDLIMDGAYTNTAVGLAGIEMVGAKEVQRQPFTAPESVKDRGRCVAVEPEDFVGKWQQITQSCEAASFTASPGPRILFGYSNKRITCCHCGAKFNHTRLWEDEDGAEDICPECGEANCAEVEYEKLTDALAELAGVQPNDH